MTAFPSRSLVLAALLLTLAGTASPAPQPFEGHGKSAREEREALALSAEERRVLAQAEKLHEEALQLWSESPEEALQRANKALELRRQVLGAEHVDYAASLDSAARIYKVLGDYPRAKSLYEEALSIRKRLLGVEHPDYRESLKNLAGLYYLLEDYERARSYFNEATRIERRLTILEHIGRPAAWMAIRSYDAVEGTLAELSRLESGAADAVSLVEMVKREVGSLDGLDRTRPLGVSFPVLGESKQLGVVLSIPYSDREKITGIVLRFFPVINEKDGLLLLEGGPFPAFGHLDEEDSLLLLSTVGELLSSPHARVPPDLFAQEDGASVVLRIDFESALSLRASPVKFLEEWFLDRLQGLGSRLASGDRYYEELFRRLFSDAARHLIDRLLDQFTTADIKLWLAGEWRSEVKIRVRPEAAAASFLAAQDSRLLRLPAVSSPDRVAGMQAGVHLNEELLKEAALWLTSVRQWVETNPPPMEDSSAAVHQTRLQVAPKLLAMCERLFAEERIEAGCELTVSEGEPAVVLWVGGSRCGADLLALMELARRGSRLPGGASKLVPGFDRHGGTPIHVIRDDGEPIYLAAEDRFLLICLGASPRPLKTILDATREQGPLPPGRAPRAFLEMNLSPAGVAGAGFSEIQGAESPVAAAFRDSILAGPDTLLSAALEAGETALTLRGDFPEPLLPALAAALRASLLSRVEPTTGPGAGGGASKDE